MFWKNKQKERHWVDVMEDRLTAEKYASNPPKELIVHVTRSGELLIQMPNTIHLNTLKTFKYTLKKEEELEQVIKENYRAKLRETTDALEQAIGIVQTILDQQGGLVNEKNNGVYNLTGTLEQWQEQVNKNGE